MRTMAERDARYTLGGGVQVDDVYLGGELSGGTAGRGSENKVPFGAAVLITAEGYPQYVKLAPVPGFTSQAIADWTRADRRPGCCLSADGLGCFAGVTAAGCRHQPVIVGGRKPRDLPEFSSRIAATAAATSKHIQRLLVAAATTGPRPEPWLRHEAACQSGENLTLRAGLGRVGRESA